MKKSIYLFLIFVGFQINAQNHPACDGERFRSDVFDEVSVTTGVKFGEGITFGGNFQELYMDIYEPVGDNAETRPVIVLAFGGSFIFGQRQDMDWLCRAYAKKGFVAATIDYRLYDGGIVPLPTEEEMQDVVVKAIGDMKAAIRYLREDAATENLYKIDSDFIYSGGISAGGITAAHVGCLDSTDVIEDNLRDIVAANGGFEGNSSFNYEYSSEVYGFVNFSGALADAHWIDENDAPFFSVHDEFDSTVPYGSGFASVFTIPIAMMEGSLIMSQVGDSLGVQNELHTIVGSNQHVGYFNTSAGQAEYLDLSAEFLYTLVCENSISSNDEAHKLDFVNVYPNPTDGMIFLQNEDNVPLKLRLFNSLGQKLGDWENVNEINLSSFQNGMYYLEFLNEQTNSKIIKRVVLEQ